MYVHLPLICSLAIDLETAASAKIHILTAAKQQISMQKEGLNREKSPSCRSFGFCFPVLKESSVFGCRVKSFQPRAGTLPKDSSYPYLTTHYVVFVRRML